MRLDDETYRGLEVLVVGQTPVGSHSSCFDLVESIQLGCGVCIWREYDEDAEVSNPG
jgi:hypothetical protein